VAYKTGCTYALAASQGTVQYHSDQAPPKDGEKTLTLPLKIYDTTADSSRLRIDEMYTVGQVLSDQKVQIINAYMLSNDGDRTIQGGKKATNGQQATLRFYLLPAGATDIEVQDDDGKTFLRTVDSYVTTWGAAPGINAAQVAVRCLLPYTGQLHLETRVRYPVQKVRVLMADQGITLTSASLVDQSTQTGQDGVVRRACGGRLTQDGLLQMLRRLGKRAGVEHCHAHRFRRTFAKLSLKAGMNVYVLAELMGYADLSMVQQYLPMDEDDLMSAYRAHSPVDTCL
jgi:Phage integrase family